MITILLYTQNNADILKSVIDRFLSQEWNVVVIDDGSEDNSQEIVKRYLKGVDLIRFDAPRGFDESMFSAFRHVLRGTGAECLLSYDIESNNISILERLVALYKQHPRNAYLVERVGKISWTIRTLNAIWKFIAKVFKSTDVHDHLTSYMLFRTAFLAKVLPSFHDNEHFSLPKLMLKLGKMNASEYEWITDDEERKESISLALKSFDAFW